MQEIQRYAVSICATHLEGLFTRYTQAAASIKERMQSTNRAITVVHPEAVILQGRIVSNAGGQGVLLTLESPVRVNAPVHLHYPRCLAEAMAGWRVWDGEGNLTERCLNDARKQLIGIYSEYLNRERHASTIRLAQDLNAANH